MGMNPKPTLCWDCQNSVLKGCTWADHYEPVEGWSAERHMVDGQVSYLVIECPQFIRDAYRNGRYSPAQYIEYLENQTAKLNGKVHKLNETIRDLTKELAEQGNEKPQKTHKHFGE